jgi:hypothetical protein
VRRGGKAPDRRGDREADADTHFIGEPAHAGIADRIRDREEEDDVAEIRLAEMQLALDCRL